ncbi:hypothetical protein VTO73DRAFT_9582 [Trametes versicolor]
MGRTLHWPSASDATVTHCSAQLGALRPPHTPTKTARAGAQFDRSQIPTLTQSTTLLSSGYPQPNRPPKPVQDVASIDWRPPE